LLFQIENDIIGQPMMTTRRIRIPLWMICLCWIFFFPTAGKAQSEKWETNQFIQNEIAYRYRESAAFTKLLTYYQIEVHYAYSPKLKWTGIGRLSYDPIYDLQDLDTTNPFQNRFQTTEPRDISHIKHFYSRIRELYADLFFEKADIRIGKQIARWGVIEGFRITDELNPLDFSEFLLRELTDRYIPLWMVKADYYFQNMTLEWIWIPELKFNQSAPPGSEWEEFQLPPGLEPPPRTLLNTETGLRLSKIVKGADLAVSYFDAWDDFPTASRTIFGLAGDLSNRATDFIPRYHRLRTFGFSASKAVGESLLKGEAAYVIGKVFGTLPVDFNGDGISDLTELKKNYWKYGLGWDTRLPGGVTAFLQFSQQWIFNYDPAIIARRVESGGSLFLQKNLMYDRLILKFFILYMVNDREALIRPRAEYQWTDRLKVSFGADLFEGKPGNIQQDDFRFIGFFNLNDRIYTEIRYSF
jgi:hypothetical protein